jgi:hypothetical protein
MASQTQRGAGGGGTGTGTGTGSKPALNKKLPSAFQIWFEDAWAGWLKHVSLILLAGLLFILYQTNALNERLLGILMALAVSLGALALAGVPARGHVKSSAQRSALYVLLGVWALVATYPIIYGVFPGRVLASGKLGDEGSQVTLDAPDGGKTVHLMGHIKGGGDVIASYRIAGSWQGGGRTVDGELSRSIARVRVGRRGSGTSVTEHNEQKHYLGRTHGQVTLKLENKDESLDKELMVELRSAPVPPIVIFALAGLVFVVALGMDRVLDPKGRTSLGVAAAVSLVFALYFGFDQAHPNRVVTPAIGSFFVAIVGGGIGGWVIAWVVKKMTPEKKARRPARA